MKWKEVASMRYGGSKRPDNNRVLLEANERANCAFISSDETFFSGEFVDKHKLMLSGYIIIYRQS